MSNDLTKKAAEMLLQGATLLSEPCPYCKGVRVMKEGQALCVSCGRQPEKKEISKEIEPKDSKISIKKTLEQKLDTLTKELESEKDHEKQQKILKSINSLLEAIEKLS
ncbi:MAG: hypothetical protein J4F36_00445 [Nitrosopumilaceae archaeon]|nr:hypothetical protein [Nitrosopumilaceae archaeon]